MIWISREVRSVGARLWSWTGRISWWLPGAAVLLASGGCATQGPVPSPTGLDVRDARNATYAIEFTDTGHLTLSDGRFTQSVAEGSSAMLTVTLDVAAVGDLDNNGSADIASVLVTRPGGSGAFYTLHALVDQNGQARHVGSALLGDRIRVQSLSIEGAQITVRLLDRSDTTPFANEPAIPVVRRFAVRGGLLEEVTSA